MDILSWSVMVLIIVGMSFSCVFEYVMWMVLCLGRVMILMFCSNSCSRRVSGLLVMGIIAKKLLLKGVVWSFVVDKDFFSV